MQDIRLEPPDQVLEMRPYQNIRRMGLAMDGNTPNTKFKTGRNLDRKSVV